jgi:quinolinate synthase
MSQAGEAIERIRERLGRSLLILGHHYQRSSVLRHADATGDSLELARRAGRSPEAERIVFCGVRFMAESADILSGERQAVYMPNPTADCPMARMADAAQLERAWSDLAATGGEWVPVAYVNSTAEIKAFCGARGGSTCTSSNAARVLTWALAGGRRVLFLPDEHLGRNTAADLGMPDEEVATYDPRAPGGGLDAEAARCARLVVWRGFCLVHTAFTAEQVRRVREKLPTARIVVHPECPREVVRASDAHGSTSRIIEYVRAAPDGAVIVVGTELNLVERLAEQQAGRVAVKVLAPSVCANMAKTNEENLLEILTQWPEANRVRVPPDVAALARTALERMLHL